MPQLFHDLEQPQNCLGSQLILTNTSHLFHMPCPISSLNNLQFPIGLLISNPIAILLNFNQYFSLMKNCNNILG